MAAELGRHLEHDELIRARGKAAVAAEPVQLAGDREQRVLRRLVCEVIPLAALGAGGTAAPPELGLSGPQQQFVGAGQTSSRSAVWRPSRPVPARDLSHSRNSSSRTTTAALAAAVL
jgi:hypothetical protein